MTEFLPVSSSGHLVLAQKYLSIDPPGIVLEVALHLATTLAILIYFRRRLITMFRGGAGGKSGWKFAALILVASAPAAVVGLAFEAKIEALFESVQVVAFALLFTAAVLSASRLIRRGDVRAGEIGFQAALVVGAAQALAVAPGVSRSGMTIVAGLIVGLAGAEAAAFSFLLSVPAIVGAGLLEARKIDSFQGDPAGLAIASAVAFAAGLGAIYVVLIAVRGRGFAWFGVYCAALGLTVLIAN